MSLPLLSSGQDASQKYPANDGKLIHETNIQLAAIQNRILYETTRGYSLNIEGNGDGLISPANDIINSENYLNYEADLIKAIQTLISQRNLLAVKQSSTANQIVLEAIKIDNEATAPDGSNYAKNSALPFTFRNGLCFCFKAILSNDPENPTTINIEDLSGLSGAIALLNEDGSNPILEAGFYYEVIAFYDGTPANNKFYLKNGTLAKRLNNLNKLDSLLSLNGGNMKGVINMGSNKITNLANGVFDGDAVNLSQLNTLKAGFVGQMMHGQLAQNDFNGWLKWTSGRVLLKTTYALLWNWVQSQNLIGSLFSDNGLNFVMADLAGRVIGVAGQGAGLTNRNFGFRIGSETHTLKLEELPKFRPTAPAANNDKNDASSQGWPEGGHSSFRTSNRVGVDRGLISEIGGDQPHNIMQPTVFLNSFIYSGVNI